MTARELLDTIDKWLVDHAMTQEGADLWAVLLALSRQPSTPLVLTACIRTWAFPRAANEGQRQPIPGTKGLVNFSNTTFAGDLLGVPPEGGYGIPEIDRAIEALERIRPKEAA